VTGWECKGLMVQNNSGNAMLCTCCRSWATFSPRE